MRIIVCGGREFTNRQAVKAMLVGYPSDTVIVTGGARGADTLAHEEATQLGYTTEVHKANWVRHGRRAGVLRNQEMLALGADAVFAFPGGRGTADMVRRAAAANVPIYRTTMA